MQLELVEQWELHEEQTELQQLVCGHVGQGEVFSPQHWPQTGAFISSPPVPEISALISASDGPAYKMSPPLLVIVPDRSSPVRGSKVVLINFNMPSGLMTMLLGEGKLCVVVAMVPALMLVVPVYVLFPKTVIVWLGELMVRLPVPNIVPVKVMSAVVATSSIPRAPSKLNEPG